MGATVCQLALGATVLAIIYLLVTDPWRLAVSLLRCIVIFGVLAVIFVIGSILWPGGS